MSIDYVIDWHCAPKRDLSTPGILDRLKAGGRAETIIKLYRDNGDMRPPTEMGFEMARRTPDGDEEVRVIIVQEMLDQAAELRPHEVHCTGCPANRAGRPFGCFGAINYPIAQAAEVWLLRRLPTLADVLPFLLLKQTLSDSPGLGDQVRSMRATPGIIFESGDAFARNLNEFAVTTDQIFDMLFLIGAILPTYGALLMLFFGVIPRDMDADVLQNLTPAPRDWATRFPFQLTEDDADDSTTQTLKEFFAALYLAYGLNVSLSLDV